MNEFKVDPFSRPDPTPEPNYALKLTAIEAQRLVDFLTARLAEVPPKKYDERFCFTVVHAGIGSHTEVFDRAGRVSRDLTDYEAW